MVILKDDFVPLNSNIVVIQRECNLEIGLLTLWGAMIHEYILKTCINPF